MASNISFDRINENYPIAGEDNNTQVFRDNFDTIKESLRIANDEVTDLQENVARTDDTVNFNNNIIISAVLKNTTSAKLDGGTLDVPASVDFQNGSYQIFRFSADTDVSFINFPNFETLPSSVGKVTLELYSDGQARTIDFTSSNGIVIKKNIDFPEPLVLTDADAGGGAGNPVIIEVWQHDSKRLFLNYLGKFQ